MAAAKLLVTGGQAGKKGVSFQLYRLLTWSPSKATVPLNAAGPEPAGKQNKKQHPQDFDDQTSPHISPLNFAEKNGGREIGEILKGHELDKPTQINRFRGQELQGEHMTRQEKVQEHVNEGQRSHFQEPEGDQADTGFQVKPEQKT